MLPRRHHTEALIAQVAHAVTFRSPFIFASAVNIRHNHSGIGYSKFSKKLINDLPRRLVDLGL